MQIFQMLNVIFTAPLYAYQRHNNVEHRQRVVVECCGKDA